MLALAALSQGMVWSSCSPDFGVDGVLERFGQIEPKVLFCADGYRYNGRDARLARARARDRRAAADACARSSWCRTWIPTSTSPTSRRRCGSTSGCAATSPATSPYAQLPFDHPVYILFTSGTTGKPKCIVHGAGGALLQAPEDVQAAVRRAARATASSTTAPPTGWCGTCSSPASCAEASVMLYDGSPFARNGSILFDYAEKERIHPLRHLGQVPRCDREARPAAARYARPRGAAHDHLDRLAARRRELRLRVRERQERRVPVVDLRRHRHHGARSPTRTRCCRCTAASCSAARSAWRSRCSTRREIPSSARKASWSAPSPFRPCRSASGTTAAASATTRPTSRNTRTSGATATGASSPSAARCSSTAARTRRSTPAACASAPPRSIAWWSASTRSRSRWRSASSGRRTSPTDTRVVLFVQAAGRLHAGRSARGAHPPRDPRDHATPRHVPATIVQVARHSAHQERQGGRARGQGRWCTACRWRNTDALANPEALELFRDLHELST